MSPRRIWSRLDQLRSTPWIRKHRPVCCRSVMGNFSTPTGGVEVQTIRILRAATSRAHHVVRTDKLATLHALDLDGPEPVAYMSGDRGYVDFAPSCGASSRGASSDAHQIEHECP